MNIACPRVFVRTRSVLGFTSGLRLLNGSPVFGSTSVFGVLNWTTSFLGLSGGQRLYQGFCFLSSIGVAFSLETVTKKLLIVSFVRFFPFENSETLIGVFAGGRRVSGTAVLRGGHSLLFPWIRHCHTGNTV